MNQNAERRRRRRSATIAGVSHGIRDGIICRRVRNRIRVSPSSRSFTAVFGRNRLGAGRVVIVIEHISCSCRCCVVFGNAAGVIHRPSACGSPRQADRKTGGQGFYAATRFRAKSMPLPPNASRCYRLSALGTETCPAVAVFLQSAAVKLPALENPLIRAHP